MSKQKQYISLSYVLKNSDPTYNNSPEISMEPLVKISDGGSCNKTFLKISSHVGTHIDFPYHFLDDGIKGEDVAIEDLMFDNCALLEIDASQSFLSVENINQKNLESIDLGVQFLMLKTNWSEVREEEKYWRSYPALSPELASFLIERFKNLAVLAIDLISIASPDYPVEAVESHKILLSNNTFIIEDADFSNLSSESKVKEVMVVPFLFENCDGTPCSILAKIN